MYWLFKLTATTTWISQRALHNEPIFRLLLKVAVNGTHQCDFPNFCGQQCPTMDKGVCVQQHVFFHIDSHKQLSPQILHCNLYQPTPIPKPPPTHPFPHFSTARKQMSEFAFSFGLFFWWGRGGSKIPKSNMSACQDVDVHRAVSTRSCKLTWLVLG